jgi:hypothetical protein
MMENQFSMIVKKAGLAVTLPYMIGMNLKKLKDAKIHFILTKRQIQLNSIKMKEEEQQKIQVLHNLNIRY